jgi:hypothetical protein
MRRLEPDEFEIGVVMKPGLLMRCPFCNRWAMIATSINDKTQIYRGLVVCVGCHAEIGHNALSREEARDGAVTRWNARV